MLSRSSKYTLGNLPFGPREHTGGSQQTGLPPSRKTGDLGRIFLGGWNVSFQGNALKSYAFDNVVTLISNLVVCDLGEA